MKMGAEVRLKHSEPISIHYLLLVYYCCIGATFKIRAVNKSFVPSTLPNQGPVLCRDE